MSAEISRTDLTMIYYVFVLDLMLPGVIVRGELTPNTFKGVEKWQICSVSLYGNRYFMLLPQTFFISLHIGFHCGNMC